MKDKGVLAEGRQPSAGRQGISGTGLKIIALAAMLMDHIHYMFAYTGMIPWWFSLAGRVAAPLFLFCFVEGFVHTGNRKKYFGRILCVAVPMGLLLFFMRFGGILVRPDGFYPQNAMLLSFVLLFFCFQAFEWIGSRRLGKAAAGCAVLLGLFLWPFLAAILGSGPISGTVMGILAYTLLPMLNISGDVTLSVLLLGIVLYLTHKNRRIQAAAMVLFSLVWDFGLVYLQLRNWTGFELSQMFTRYYEWMGAVFAAPLLLLYNGKRGAGYGRFFYVFYPAHIYILYALSWLLMVVAG